MNLPKKGTMRPVKYVLGGLLIFYGISATGMLQKIVMIAGGILLLISGRQDR